MKDNHNVNARITSVNRRAANEWKYKDHAEDGVHFLSGTGAAPTDKYYGFIVTGDTTVISSISYIDSSKQSGDITLITLVQGIYYPIPGLFSTITLTSGDLILLKYTDKV